IVDGLVRVDDLVKIAAKCGMPAVAVTDQGNLFSMIKFYSAAMSAGVKPVCGCDVLIENPERPDRPFTLTLLVKNLEGYRNLTRLISRSYTEEIGHGAPQLRYEWLLDRNDGLIALSGGMSGDVGRALVDGDGAAAMRALAVWMNLFPNSFYLTVSRCGRPGEDSYNQAAARLASDTDCPLVAVNDVRFLSPDDFEAHEVRVCIHERRTLDDPRRPR